jgi:glycerol-3-phosphate cytidylyltransferase
MIGPRGQSALHRRATEEKKVMSQDQKIVGYLPGGWDMFHVGHLNIILRARKLCDELIAAVVSDEVLFSVKNKHPVVPLEERMEMVASLKIVDRVVPDFTNNKVDAWKRYRFDVIFKGDDWRGTAKGLKLEADMATVGVEVRYFPYTSHTSSSALRELITARV